MGIKIVKLSIVVALTLLAVGGYSWYRYMNQNVITIGSVKSDKELESIGGFIKKHQINSQKERVDDFRQGTYKILNGGDFYEELTNFNKYLKENDVDFDDTILVGEYNMSTNHYIIKIRCLIGIEKYHVVWFTFGSNNLTKIETNEFNWVGSNEKQRLEKDVREYEVDTNYDDETQKNTKTFTFTLQTGEFFKYLSSHPKIAPKEFIELMRKELKNKSKMEN